MQKQKRTEFGKKWCLPKGYKPPENTFAFLYYSFSPANTIKKMWFLSIYFFFDALNRLANFSQNLSIMYHHQLIKLSLGASGHKQYISCWNRPWKWKLGRCWWRRTQVSCTWEKKMGTRGMQKNKAKMMEASALERSLPVVPDGISHASPFPSASDH